MSREKKSFLFCVPYDTVSMSNPTASEYIYFLNVFIRVSSTFDAYTHIHTHMGIILRVGGGNAEFFPGR